MSEFTVLIAGAGLGGLTLAQSLVRAGIDVRLFERDRGPFDRPQGYRLHLDADAINAAREVLPPDLHTLFQATSQLDEPFTTILGTDLTVIRRIRTDDGIDAAAWPGQDGGPDHVNVDRATLRQILLAGLEDRIHYGKTLDTYENTSDGVVAHFHDGTQAAGHVLVGADGLRSAVRRQRAPDRDTVDAGVTAIYGRIKMAAAAPFVPKEVQSDIFAIGMDERKVFLGLGAVRFPVSPTLAVQRFRPGTHMLPQEDYLVCIVGGRHAFFPGGLHEAAPADLQHIAAATLSSWPTQASALVQAGDPAAFFAVRMSTSVPCALDAPANVTLLGDAIHAMTPTLGRGANIAMRDGALLGRALRQVATGKTPLAQALADYERHMLAYGFDVVREAARIGQQRMAQNPLPA